MSKQLFLFPFLFSGYFYSVNACVVYIVSVLCYQSSSALFYVVFCSLNRCIDVILNASESFSSFFSWHIHSVYVIPGIKGLNASPWVSLFSSPFVEILLTFTSRMVPSILWEGQPRYLSLWWDFCHVVCFRVVFTFSRGIFKNIFLSSPHVWFGSSIPFLICRFPFFIIRMAHSSMPNAILISSLYILTACFRVSKSISFLANSLLSSMYIRWLIFFFLAIYEVFIHLSFPKYVTDRHHRCYKYSWWKRISLEDPQAFSSCCQFNSLVFHGILDRFHDFSRYCYEFGPWG